MIIAQIVNDTLTNPVLTKVASENQMNLWDMAVKGGWIMIVLAILSIICVYLFFERWSVLRKAVTKNEVFMMRIRDCVAENDLKTAINCCRTENTPAARMIEKGMNNLDHPEILREVLENTANIEISKLEKGIPAISTISACAPMIGFLGTVTGMVSAFWQMANAGNNIDVSLLSGGIYEAMITTVGGLIVGIVAIFMHNYLTSIIDRIQTGMEADILLFIDFVHEKSNKQKQ